MTKLDQVLIDAKDDLREQCEDGTAGMEESIYEIADSHVPVYHSDLLDMAAEDNELATTEPDIGPAFDGSPTPVNIIAANVFEAIAGGLYGLLEELKDEEKERDENVDIAKQEAEEAAEEAGHELGDWEDALPLEEDYLKIMVAECTTCSARVVLSIRKEDPTEVEVEDQHRPE